VIKGEINGWVGPSKHKSSTQRSPISSHRCGNDLHWEWCRRAFEKLLLKKSKHKGLIINCFSTIIFFQM
jgi:hypothetical protein